MAKNIIDTDAKEFQIFFDGCVEIFNKFMVEQFPTLPIDEMSYKKGRRYIKIIRGGSVHCFVDMTNGDVLKAASWKAPAKHARGNIFDSNNGLDVMGEYGPKYLRG